MSREKHKRTKVLVGLSGGVDSSAALLLLKEQGFDVAGIYFKTGNFSDNENCQRAKKVATLLGIRLFKKNISKEFKDKVVNDFIKKYKNNLTPNPCVICNPQIKFKFLIQEARKNEFDFVATGHYARIKKDKKGNFILLKGGDKEKDQAYFLYRLSQETLKKILFPLGDFKKEQIREKIKKSVLNGIDFQKESQDVCFFSGGKNLKNFLGKNIRKTRKGDIVDESGNALGKHKGLEFYTKGQRQGLNLSGGPFFVIDKDVRGGKLIVSKSKNHPKLLADKISIKKVSWIGDEPEIGKRYYFKNRYGSKPAAGHFIKKDKKWVAVMEKKQWAVMEGQSLVAYDGQKVVGGGMIARG